MRAGARDIPWRIVKAAGIAASNSTKRRSINGASDRTVGDGVEVGSAATLGTDTAFAGNLLADQAITFGSGASILCGRAFSLDAAVTLDTDTVSDSCTHGGDFGTGRSDFGSSGFSPADVPEPAAWLMILAGFSGLGGVLRAGRQWRSPSL